MRKTLVLALIILGLLSCGKSNNDNELISGKIIGGKPVLDREYDFTVALFNEENKFFCSGALISPTLVLTAAHCVLGHKIKSIGVGNSTPFEQYPVLNSGYHPMYMATISHSFYIPGANTEALGHNKNMWDYGFVTLAVPVRNVIPIKVLLEHSAIKSGETVTHIGLGRIEEDSFGVKHVVEVPIMTKNSFLLLTGTDKKGICFGDSGGPVVQNGQLLAVHSQLSGKTTGEDGIVCGRGEGNGQSLWWSRATCWIQKNTNFTLNAKADCIQQNLKDACYSSQSIDFRDTCSELIQKKKLSTEQITACGNMKFYDVALKCLNKLK